MIMTATVEQMVTKPGFGTHREARLAQLRELEAQGFNKAFGGGAAAKSPATLEEQALATLAAMPAGQLEVTLASMNSSERQALLAILNHYR